MIFCETTGTSRSDLEDLAIFASQLAASGLPARVDVSSIPDGPFGHNLQFDLAPRLVDGGLGPEDSLALLVADELTDAALVRLRRLGSGVDLTARVFGHFPRRETALGVRARLSYVFNREPVLYQVAPATPDLRHPAPAFGVPRRMAPAWQASGGTPRMLLVGPDLKDPVQAAALASMALRSTVPVTVLTDSKSKQAWIGAFGHEVPLFHYGEILPLALAERTGLCVFFGSTARSYRLQTLLANLLVNGTPLLDGSTGRRHASSNDAFIAAPSGILGLARFIEAEILPNLEQISAHVQASRAAATAAAGPVLDFLAPEASPQRVSPRPKAAATEPDGIVFVPTNGIGLGHAQRCALVASALGGQQVRPVFAAFPSCMRMVKSYGFDVMPLIGRSQMHKHSYENDLGNYLRLRALSAGKRTLVFDGGYVFDFIFRTVLDGPIRGVWIRRGLWQAGQDNSVALDREKVFDRVIVPSEAFDELNATYSRGDHLYPVGPVVQEIGLSAEGRDQLRARLAERYDLPYERLVVSLLGAGVAADRSLQIQALCSLFARRSDVLHLVLVWPSATLERSWFGWRNTRVVRTQHAAALSAAADLAVTASGYNSFHEMLYNGVPAIFVPQLGPSTDDQKARARAACDRGLAAMQEPTELMTLERLVLRHLDAGEAEAVRARLAMAELPRTGTRRAAEIIEELDHGPDAMEHDRVSDRTARRR